MSEPATSGELGFTGVGTCGEFLIVVFCMFCFLVNLFGQLCNIALLPLLFVIYPALSHSQSCCFEKAAYTSSLTSWPSTHVFWLSLPLFLCNCSSYEHQCLLLNPVDADHFPLAPVLSWHLIIPFSFSLTSSLASCFSSLSSHSFSFFTWSAHCHKLLLF